MFCIFNFFLIIAYNQIIKFFFIQVVKIALYNTNMLIEQTQKIFHITKLLSLDCGNVRFPQYEAMSFSQLRGA